MPLNNGRPRPSHTKGPRSKTSQPRARLGPEASINTTPQTYSSPPPFLASAAGITPQHTDTHAYNIGRALLSGRAKGTMNNYASAVRSYLEWCKTNHIHRSSQFPASEYTLCAFAASFAGSLSGSSVSGMLAGIRAWHVMYNAPWNSSACVVLITRGVAAEAPARSKLPPRHPVTPAMLRSLSENLNRADPFDSAVLAAALVAFWGQFRLGELLGRCKATHDPSVFPSRWSLGPAISANGSRELSLPSTKTHRMTGEKVVLTFQSAPLNPIAALEHHLHASRHLAQSSHRFAFAAQKRGKTQCLTKFEFLARCNSISERHGHGHTTGHAFRIGGTTSLLQAGIAPDVVHSIGQWSSDAHFRY
jgi:hypothetical protein